MHFHSLVGLGLFFSFKKWLYQVPLIFASDADQVPGGLANPELTEPRAQSGILEMHLDDAEVVSLTTVSSYHRLLAWELPHGCSWLPPTGSPTLLGSTQASCCSCSFLPVPRFL